MTNQVKKFLFRCDACQMILSVDFSDEEDLQDVEDNKIELECPCGSKCKVLRD